MNTTHAPATAAAGLGLVGKETALVVVDLQDGTRVGEFGPHSFDDVLARSLELVSAARDAGALVVYVRSGYYPDLGDKARFQSDVRPSPSGIPVEDPAALVPEITPLENEPVIVKRSWNSFHGNDLDLQLRRRGIRNVILTGVTTNFGVEGTGRNAIDLGYSVIYVSDAMSSPTAELHNFAVTSTFPYLGRVRTTDQVVAALADAGTAA